MDIATGKVGYAVEGTTAIVRARKETRALAGVPSREVSRRQQHRPILKLRDLALRPPAAELREEHHLLPTRPCRAVVVAVHNERRPQVAAPAVVAQEPGSWELMSQRTQVDVQLFVLH